MSDLLLSLISFALIATISPGGATTLATASGARFGFVRSIPLICGIAAGLGLLVGAVAAGLGAVIQSRPQLDFGLRVAGSLYILWLALMIGRQGAPAGTAGGATPPGLASGVVLIWSNPKGWTMAAATASAFSGLGGNPARQAVICGVVFASAAFLSTALWCGGGAWLARLLRSEAQ